MDHAIGAPHPFTICSAAGNRLPVTDPLAPGIDTAGQ